MVCTRSSLHTLESYHSAGIIRAGLGWAGLDGLSLTPIISRPALSKRKPRAVRHISGALTPSLAHSRVLRRLSRWSGQRQGLLSTRSHVMNPFRDDSCRVDFCYLGRYCIGNDMADMTYSWCPIHFASRNLRVACPPRGLRFDVQEASGT